MQGSIYVRCLPHRSFRNTIDLLTLRLRARAKPQSRQPLVIDYAAMITSDMRGR
jgi:hypothetical protein